MPAQALLQPYGKRPRVRATGKCFSCGESVSGESNNQVIPRVHRFSPGRPN